MATSGSGRKRRPATRKNTASKSTASRKTSAKKQQVQNDFIREEIQILILFAVSILLLISDFGIGGKAGDFVSGILFGLFGFCAYLLPIALFVLAVLSVSRRENMLTTIKGMTLMAEALVFCGAAQLLSGEAGGKATVQAFYAYSSAEKKGGGVIGGMIAKGLTAAFGTVGAWLILVVLIIIGAVIITEHSFIGGVRRGGQKVYDSAREDAENMRRRQAERASRKEELREKRNREEKEQPRVSRREKKVSGVAWNTKIVNAEEPEEELIPEIPMPEPEPVIEEPTEEPAAAPETRSERQRVSMGDVHEITLEGPDLKDLDGMFRIHGTYQSKEPAVPEPEIEEPAMSREEAFVQEEPADVSAVTPITPVTPVAPTVQTAARRTMPAAEPAVSGKSKAETTAEKLEIPVETAPKPYVYPPITLLKQIRNKAGNSEQHLKETALHLQQILRDFGVGVTVTDVSCGPAVTRYELQPDQGVKVSRIVALADDIKLNLAVADIRIEAPIPGKAAVGIEVPNAENSMVSFRELVSSDEFQNHKSRIAFAVGKDIAGKTVVTDIAKMPHLLIAGATGSGKSVCINTLIMSILYKADPSDVKLIMVDPKVVELSVYNGIPHLLIPVVTDPKKAAAALNWAVAEMTDRYKKFAECNVRNLQGYNEKIKNIENINDENKPKKLPQIVIIVDELADLMMVASSEVEDAICRLAQLARAAGIHLIIATQRPSVNVITGLIKANMPSRVAFAVSSGVDSRTILDMNGAEKLLGKGDMLFYPSGLPKPIRVQGAFVSDEEVGAVVDFLSDHNIAVTYSNAVEEHISNAQNAAAEPAAAGGGESGDGRDVLFAEAGKFIIEKDKASIGMLQRWFKVGFNRAARIMDQLADAGVVGEEAGTKPREILMTMEEFTKYLEETM